MDKYELLWNDLKTWVKDAYPEVLDYMVQQEKAIGLAQRTIDGEFSDSDVLNPDAFLESILELSDAAEEEKDELRRLIKQGGDLSELNL